MKTVLVVAAALGLSATGALADLTGHLGFALLLPAACYAIIAAFGVYARRPAPDLADRTA